MLSKEAAVELLQQFGPTALTLSEQVELTVGGELAVKVENAAGTKCPRCWKHSLTPNAEGLCPRCAEVVRHLPDLL